LLLRAVVVVVVDDDVVVVVVVISFVKLQSSFCHFFIFHELILRCPSCIKNSKNKYVVVKNKTLENLFHYSKKNSAYILV